MALIICKFYKMDLSDFIFMLSEKELQRNDFSVIKAREKKSEKKLKQQQRLLTSTKKGPLRSRGFKFTMK